MDKTIIDSLKEAVEKQIGFSLVTPADFNSAEAEISKVARRPVSATTLMRVWDYVRDAGEDYSPGNYTLSTLAIYLGFNDFKDYLKRGNESQSQGYNGEGIDAKEIPKGKELVIKWEPDRILRLKSLGDGRFEVTKSKNGTLQVGDIVECASFTQSAPLYCSRDAGFRPIITELFEMGDEYQIGFVEDFHT